MAKRKRTEDIPEMIEVICVAPVVNEKIVRTTNEFTKNYTYIATPTPSGTYILENNKGSTKRIPKEIFIQHFQEAI